MRKFEKKNVASFTIFGILIIAAIVAISLIVTNYVANDDSKFSVKVGELVFTDNDEIIELTSNGEIIKKWDSKFYLTNDENDSVCLGEHPLVYSNNSNELVIYGDSYRIYPDGSTLKYTNSVDVINTKESCLYKLSDRNYVFIGNEVYSYSPGFNAKNFMKIRIAKNGNALLQGTGLNSKTIDHVLLVSGELYFDVGSEILYSDGIEVNLRKVIGSTNEYNGAPILYNQTGFERPEGSTSNTEIPDIEEYNITAGAGGQGGIGGFGGNGGNAGSGGPGGLGGTGGDGGSGGTTRQDENYFMSVIGITSDMSSMTLNYFVYDPTNKIGEIYMKYAEYREDHCYDAGTFKTVELDKYAGVYTQYGLENNKTYEVSINYKEYEVDEATQTYKLGQSKNAGNYKVITKQANADVMTIQKGKDMNDYINVVMINANLKGYNLITLDDDFYYSGSKYYNPDYYKNEATQKSYIYDTEPVYSYIRAKLYYDNYDKYAYVIYPITNDALTDVGQTISITDTDKNHDLIGYRFVDGTISTTVYPSYYEPFTMDHNDLELVKIDMKNVNEIIIDEVVGYVQYELIDDGTSSYIPFNKMKIQINNGSRFIERVN